MGFDRLSIINIAKDNYYREQLQQRNTLKQKGVDDKSIQDIMHGDYNLDEYNLAKSYDRLGSIGRFSLGSLEGGAETINGIEVAEEVFDLDPLQPEKAVVDFIEVLKNNFCNVELLKTDKEKEEYGNIIIIKDKGFCDKNNFLKPISRYKENKLVYHLYKNYYSDFMLKIEKEPQVEKVKLNKKVNSIFEPFINKNVILSENEIGIIKNIEQTNNGIEVIFDVCDRNDEYKVVTSMIIKNFNDILALANYIMQNEIKDNVG